MKNTILFALILLFPLIGFSQEAYRLSLHNDQTIDNGRSSLGNLLKLPANESTVILGGLNELGSIGSYLNIYGSKLIIDSLDQSADGTKHVVLRREDGRDFYDLFPTLKARLIPLTMTEQEELLND